MYTAQSSPNLAHAVAHAMTVAKGLGREQNVLVNLSGRGDKDLDIVRTAGQSG